LIQNEKVCFILMAQVTNIIGSIVDSSDTSKVFSVSLTGATTGTSASLSFSQATNAVFTFPNATTTLVGTGTNQTITSGTWNGSVIGAIYGGTEQTTWTAGDILYSSASNVLSKLAIGSVGQVLTVAAGLPSWANSAAGVSSITGQLVK